MSEAKFRPIYGCSDTEPLCFLLEIDDCRILLDCGWDERFSLHTINALTDVVETVDFVLLSHSSIAHLGAITYACAKLKLDCPVFATLPVWRMGQMAMVDAFFQARDRRDFDLFSFEDIESVFEKFTKVTYSQEIHLTGRGDGITLMPFAAGHSLGGSIWKITKETEEIVYAVDINHRRERHLDGTVLESACTRPSLLIIDAYYALVRSKLQKARNRDLFSEMMKTLSAGGNVLIPVDPSSRVLELMHFLHSQWAARSLNERFGFAFLSPTSKSSLEFAAQLVEWMSSTCQKAADDKINNSPFRLPEMARIFSLDQLDTIKQPAVVLASSTLVNGSFAEDLLREWYDDEKNLILFTTKPRIDSIAKTLLSSSTDIEFTRHFKVPYSEQELAAYKALHAEGVAEAMDEHDDGEAVDEDEDEDDDDEGAVVYGAHKEDSKPDVNVHRSMFKRRVKLIPKYPMYHYEESVISADLFGEQINFEDFIVPDDIVTPVVDKTSIDKVEVKKESVEDIPMLDVDTPMHVREEFISLRIRCRVVYVDCEGRSDGASLKTIIAHVAPRKVLLVHGTQQAKNSIRKFCDDKITECQVVLTPNNGQNVLVTAESNILKVKLRDALHSTLEFVAIGDYEVAYVEGELSTNADSRYPVLQSAPEKSLREHDAVFLGDVRMSDVKKALARAGVSSQFVSGILVCASGAVNIRKASKTQISVNGAMCDEYFKIRDVLYQQYQVV